MELVCIYSQMRGATSNGKERSVNKVSRLYAAILFHNEAKNADIALATTRLFNEIMEQKGK